jgi:hypothetical protein
MKYLQEDGLSDVTARFQECRLGRRRVQGRVEAYSMKRAGTDKKYAAELTTKYVEWQDSLENNNNEFMTNKTYNNNGVVTDDDDSQRTLGNNDNSSSLQQQQQQQQRKRSVSVGVFGEHLTYSSRMMQQQRDIKRPRSNSDDGLLLRSSLQQQQQQSDLGDFGDMATRRLMTDLILTLNMSYPDYDFGTARPQDFTKRPVSEVMRDVNAQLNSSPVFLEGGASDGLAPNALSNLVGSIWPAIDAVISLKECDAYLWNSPDMADDEPVVDEQVESAQGAVLLWSFHYFFVNKALKRIVFFTCGESMQEEEEQDDGEGDSVVVAMADDSVEIDFDLDPSSAQAGGIPISQI